MLSDVNEKYHQLAVFQLLWSGGEIFMGIVLQAILPLSIGLSPRID
jgi:hypothetical protein